MFAYLTQAGEVGGRMRRPCVYTTGLCDVGVCLYVCQERAVEGASNGVGRWGGGLGRGPGPPPLFAWYMEEPRHRGQLGASSVM